VAPEEKHSLAQELSPLVSLFAEQVPQQGKIARVDMAGLAEAVRQASQRSGLNMLQPLLPAGSCTCFPMVCPPGCCPAVVRRFAGKQCVETASAQQQLQGWYLAQSPCSRQCNPAGWLEVRQACLESSAVSSHLSLGASMCTGQLSRTWIQIDDEMWICEESSRGQVEETPPL